MFIGEVPIMPTNPSDDLLYALKRFVQATANSPRTGEDSLTGNELDTARQVASAIDRIIDMRVQAALSRLPNPVAAVANHQMRTPQRRG
jgi:hypothetical protein